MNESLAHIALGSNIEPRLTNLLTALDCLCAGGNVTCVAKSAVYETEPVGGPEGQGPYYNAAIAVLTRFSPHELLAYCLDVERQCGRVRTVSNGPRTIDLDILLFGDVVIDSPELVVPHPRLHERLFVLTPLLEIAEDVRHPRLGSTVGELNRNLASEAGSVRRLNLPAWNRHEGEAQP